MEQFFKQVAQWAADMGAGLAARILSVIVIAVAGGLLIRLILRLVKKALERSKLEKGAHGLIKTLVRTVLYALLGLILASALGIDVTGVVALASVLTLAVSLALQNMLANVIGGFTILYTHPFKSGDYVEIAGQSGTVTEIGMTYTQLATPDNKLVSIPNSAVVAAQIVNYSATGVRRAEINVTVSYETPVETARQTLLSVADHPLILQEPAPPMAVLSAYGDSGIVYTLRFWVKTEDFWNVYYEVNQNIKPAFHQAGVEMTYPHINVHLEK